MTTPLNNAGYMPMIARQLEEDRVIVPLPPPLFKPDTGREWPVGVPLILGAAAWAAIAAAVL